MNKIAPLIALTSLALLMGNPVLAKGKDQVKGKHQAQTHQEKGQKHKDKHQSESRLENSNRQSLEDSRRAQERAEERHDMHEQPGYGEPQYGDPMYGDPRYGDPRYGTPPNPVDTLIDRGADSLKSGARNLLPPPPPLPRR